MVGKLAVAASGSGLVHRSPEAGGGTEFGLPAGCDA